MSTIVVRPQLQPPVVSYITDRIKSRPEECPKVLILYKLQTCVLQCCNGAQDLCSKQSKFTCSHIVDKLKGIQKSKKSLLAAFGPMYVVCLFFSLQLPKLSVLAFRIFVTKSY